MTSFREFLLTQQPISRKPLAQPLTWGLGGNALKRFWSAPHRPLLVEHVSATCSTSVKDDLLFFQVAGARGGNRSPVATVSQQVAEFEEESEQKIVSGARAQLLNPKVGLIPKCLCPRAGMWEGPPVT